MAETTEVLVTEFRADIKRFEASMRKQARSAERSAADMRKSFARANRQVVQSANDMSRDVRRAIGAIALGVGTRNVASYADAWVDLNNKIAAAGVVADREGRGVIALAEQARNARQEIEPYADLYARLLRTSGEIADSEEEVAKATNLAAKAFKAGGASAQEQAAGILQLGQALGSGFLQGDELRSIRENAPLVAKAIADAMGVSIGELKKLGAEGKLTSDIVFRALLSAEQDIEAAFGATVPRATDQAVLAFDNLKLKIGEFSQETGLVETPANALAEVLNFMADNVDAMADAIVVAGAALTGALGAQVLINVTAGLNSIAVGATATAKAMHLLRAASAFMFGPAGLIIGAGALAGTLAYLAITADDAATGSSELAVSTQEATDALLAYDDALRATNGLTGAALEHANSLAETRREEAIATLEAAQAERVLAIEREKRIAREIRKLDVAPGGRFAKQQQDELRRSSQAVQELEADARAAQDQLERLLSGRYRKEKDRPSRTRNSSRSPRSPNDAPSGDGNDIFDTVGENYERALEEARRQRDRELQMIADLEDRRDEVHGRQLTIIDREYKRRREAIENEIRDEQRKHEALTLLEDEFAEYKRQLRNELLGTAESGNPEIDRIRAIEAEKLAALREALDLEDLTRTQYEQRRIDLARQTEDEIAKIRTASTQVQLAASEKLFGSLGDLAKEFAGEQSGVYKALFAVEKAFAIASSIIAIQTGVANALSLPFPANLGAAATVAAQGASVISNIRAVSNFRDGGIDIRGAGSGRSDSIPAMISAGESVITAKGTRKNAGLLAAINAGHDVERALSTGGSQTVIDASVTIGTVTHDNMSQVKAMLDRQRNEILGAVPGISRATRQDDKRRGRI